METWKPVVGYESHYQVSDFGKVRRISSGRILKPGRMTVGYLFVALCVDGKPKLQSIHRLVAAAFIGNCPDGHQVNHRDGNKLNNVVTNLEYVTRSENIQHGMDNLPRKPTSLRGTLVPNAKLDEAKVRVIKRRLRAGESQKTIADDYGVVRQVIYGIAKGKGWKWVE